MAQHSAFLTIVSGLPRSGTSMMMKMLEAGGMPVFHDKIREADVDNPGGYYEFEAAKRTKQDPSWLEGSEGKAVKMVYELLYDLPPNHQYRVLFMRRRMDEVLASQRKMLDRLGKSDDQVTDDQMAKLFQIRLRKFEQWITQQPNFAMLEVMYHDMVEAPEPLVAKINAFLGGELQTQAMCAIVAPELYRNRR